MDGGWVQTDRHTDRKTGIKCFLTLAISLESSKIRTTQTSSVKHFTVRSLSFGNNSWAEMNTLEDISFLGIQKSIFFSLSWIVFGETLAAIFIHSDRGSSEGEDGTPCSHY